MGKGEKRRRDATGDRPTPGTRSRVLAWADAHSIDISNDEADDLVRRLDESPDSAGAGQHGRVPTPPGGIPDMLAPPEDDRAPGMAVGEDGGRAMRYDYRYLSPVAVTLKGERAVAAHPPSDGRVRLRPEGGDARPVVAAVDDLDDAERLALRSAPVTRRVEVVVRCRGARHCGKAYRAWLRDDGSIEDTSGREICKVHDLFLASCGDHGRGRRDSTKGEQD